MIHTHLSITYFDIKHVSECMLKSILRTNKRLLATMSSEAAKKPSVQQPQWHQPTGGKPQPVLKIYNSLTRSKDEFIPITPGHVTWYSCGPTVYDHSHMGHARNYVSTDICRRVFRDYFGYNVKFIQNVTDIDDKIIIAARQAYLFEQNILNVHKELSPELQSKTEEFLSFYISKNLPEFTGDIKTEFISWAESVNITEVAKEKPKLPMYLKAAKTAHDAIYGTKYSIDEFLAKIKEVALPSLDKEFGHTVNDPSIFRSLPSFWENKFNEDMQKLNVLPPSITTRVSEYVPEIIEFIDKIVENGFAYKTSDGSVYFDTVKFEADPNHDYAKLQPWNKGNLSLISEGEGSLTTEGSKRSSADFALWKGSKPGEPSWPSKWGEGRPGWHIECSVMASDIGGQTLDIHSGGVDLCFPHHDNELAQSEAYFDNKQWINYFMHNGHLHIQGQKMSKSLKNFITIEEALQDFSSRQLRLVFALSAWDRPIDFKDSLIKEVKSFESTISKFFTNVRALNNDFKHTDYTEIIRKISDEEKKLYDDLSQAQTEVHEALCDNISTPQALRSVIELVSKTNNYIQRSTAEKTLRIEVLLEITRWISKILNILGFEVRSDKLGWLESNESESESGASKEDIVMPYLKALSAFRDNVRNLAINKADVQAILQASDNIRAELINLGVSLDDRPTGTALVKLLNDQEKEELIQQQAAKEKAQAEKELKKQKQAEANLKKEQERLAKMKINPSDLFRDPTLYSEWDEQGIPTKDSKGEEVTKSMRKKLSKQYQQQEKLYNEYLKTQSQA